MIGGTEMTFAEPPNLRLKLTCRGSHRWWNAKGIISSTMTRRSYCGWVLLIALACGCLDDSAGPYEGLVIEVKPAYQDPILTASVGSLLPLTCRVLRDGYEVQFGVTVTAAQSVVSGSRCSNLVVRRSGLDTLRFTAHSAVATLPIAVAVPAVVNPPLGDSLLVDSLPPGEPWAPTLRRNSHGQLEIYFASIVTNPGSIGYEDIHRLVSDDSVHFRYDGVVLRHDPNVCSLTGSGFENLAVVPRQEAPGWRMFVAGGSFACYDWQIFSATSTDERTWTLEPGIRVANESDSAMANPFATGEGIVVDLLPSGGWRMVTGAAGRAPSDTGRFQILQWNSPDQLTWTYVRSVLTTSQMPDPAQGGVYSPTIRQVAPGLWRMVFTGDDGPGQEGRSSLWSAVSTDLETWQVEGLLMGASTTNFFYSSMEGDRLVFIRLDHGARLRLGIAKIAMP